MKCSFARSGGPGGQNVNKGRPPFPAGHKSVVKNGMKLIVTHPLTLPHSRSQYSDDTKAVKESAACLWLMSCKETIHNLLHLLVGRLTGWLVASGIVYSKYKGGYAI